MRKTLQCFLLAIATILTFAQCDDNTDSIGGSIVPDRDIIIAETKYFDANSNTVLANDSILASVGNVYLGQYTDSESDTKFTSSFITQFACGNDFEFPEEGVIGNTSTSTTLRLYFNEYYGDSLNTMSCEVYELDKTLEEGVPYYTNLDPAEFCAPDKAPLAKKTFSVIDFQLSDSLLESDYAKHVEIPLPDSIGHRFITKYYGDADNNQIGKQYFENSESFINNVFKGIYVKCTHGDGTVIKIFRSRIDIGFERYIKSSTGEDSIQPLIAPFYSSKEVLQANKFDNNDLKHLLDEKEHTYIKTPAGLFTEIELPITDIVENCDTINSATITFTRYNETAGFGNKAHDQLLMLRKSEMHRFFLKNKLDDDETSFLAYYNSSSNEYTFSNIANLIRYCYNEYNENCDNPEWIAKNPDWNKVILIPVETTKDTNGGVVKITHDTSIKSMRLRGGTEYNIPIKIVTSKYKE